MITMFCIVLYILAAVLVARMEDNIVLIIPVAILLIVATEIMAAM